MNKPIDVILQERIGWKPHRAQQEILDGLAQYTSICAGTRFGKTMLCAYIALRELLQPQKRVWVIAATYDLSKKIYSYLVLWLGKGFSSDVRKGIIKMSDRSGAMKIENRFSGSWIEFKSTDNPTCYDNETEILTKDGWKYFKDLEKSDLVLTRKDGNAEYQKIKRIIDESYNGKLITINSKSLDVAVTPNHRMLIRKRYSGKEKIIPVSDLKSNDTIPAVSAWKGINKNYLVLPSIIKKFYSYKHKTKAKRLLMKDWVAFLGIFLAEGSTAGSKGGTASIKKGNYQVFISQKIEENRKKIKKLLDKLPFHYREKREGFEILNKRLWTYLKPLGNSYQKYIPKNIKQLSPKYLNILWKWMVLGDGWTHKGQIGYCSSSKKLINDVQEILQKIGRYGIIYKREPAKNAFIKGRKIKGNLTYTIQEKKRKYFSLSSNQGSYISKKEYKGRIYCCETENGIVYVRKNGKPYWSGNSLLGEELDLAIMDECPRIKTEIWESYIYQRLTSRNGQALFIGTPKGKGWFYREFVKGQDNEVKENASFTFTSKDNPYWGRPKSSPEQEWEKAKARLPERVFLQEHVGKFIENASQVFRGVRKITANCLKDVHHGHYYNIGVDLAFARDFTVLTVIDRFTHEVVYWDRFHQIEYPFQRKKIESVAKRYNNARIIIDSTGVGLPITQDLQRMGLFTDDFKFSNSSKEALIEKLAIYIERGLITIPDNDVLINELEAFGMEYTPSKKIRYSAPEGNHDDCVISLALAVWGLFKDKPPAKTPLQEELSKKRKPKDNLI